MRKIVILIVIILVFIVSIFIGINLTQNINNKVEKNENDVNKILMEVLNSERVYVLEGKDFYIDEYKLYTENITVLEYVFVDLDLDNQEELVTQIRSLKNEYGYLIFRYDKKIQKVIGYFQGIREFQDLKKDGSFSASGGADLTEYYTLTFDNDKLIKKIETSTDWRAKESCDWIKYDNNNEDINTDFEDKVIDYIIKSIKVYAEEGYILKDTSGYVLAPKLTKEEVDKNEEVYKEKLQLIIDNNEYFGEIFLNDEKKCVTYKFEKILNYLDIGTHMGIGIGCVDSNYNKLYIEGREYVETDTDIIKYLNLKDEDIINIILNQIEYDVGKNNIQKNLRNVDIDVYENNKEKYIKLIKEELDYIGTELGCIGISIKEERIQVNYNYKEIIKKLGLEVIQLENDIKIELIEY